MDMTEELKKKTDRAIRLLQSIPPHNGEPIEIAYSGGKDSDVILELAKMAGIQYKAIYKCTTIDPPGTIKHCKENGVEIIRPKKTFAELLAHKGMPNQFYRFCCNALKEYPILYNVVIGVRKDEGTARAKRYTEPVMCKVFSKHKDIREQQILPILDWTIEDEHKFITERGIKLHPLYYREDGTLDLTRRLGCMCCPMAYYKKRWKEFEKYPRMLRMYLRGAKVFWNTHPNSPVKTKYRGIYEWLYAEVMFNNYAMFLEKEKNTMFAIEHDEDWYRRELEKKFNVDLDGII